MRKKSYKINRPKFIAQRYVFIFDEALNYYTELKQLLTVIDSKSRKVLQKAV